VVERTLFIVKPDAVERGLVGTIIAAVEREGLRIAALKMVFLTGATAGDFYLVHKGKDFFQRLTEYMSSGRIVAVAVEGEDAVKRLRRLCGTTDPAMAAPGTIRAAYGVNLTMNSVHASDSPTTARTEVAFFFPEID
jgi:nucleoside-diphosphate kinase